MSSVIDTRQSEQFSSPEVCLGIASVVASVALSECLFRVVYDVWGVHTATPGYWLGYGTPVLVLGLAALPFGLLFKCRRAAHVSAIAAFTLAIFSVTHFRGSHKWPGFQDLPDRSKLPFLVALTLSVLLGFAISTIVRTSHMRTAAVIVLALALVWSFFDSLRGIDLVSEFPYTRQFAILALAIITCSMFLMRKFGVEGFDEESLQFS